MDRLKLAWDVLMGRPVMYRYELRNEKAPNGGSTLHLSPRGMTGSICECKISGFDSYSQNLLDSAKE